ncbi:molybdenum import ATP-binding protein ModC [Arenicella chitinivorans]|uniref:Molybdenum import ATP-binding protein ModC n=1 Tax=Arenicella chitinivorans TaxID=1329800 RepID=A0A918VJQ9_9GAMM|nr:molybdenum ABC transporter ATP-binding protein [Arenicella chitinivorans]GHA04585.1 molybdenum import ATP-binding protein ModC [Arenicella chitinivorans]
MSLELKLDMHRGDFALQLELSLAASGVNAFYGPSGCGKTSVLRTIAGLDRASANRVRFQSTIWQGADTFVPAHRRGALLVSQHSDLFPHLNVRGNLKFAASRASRPSARFALNDVVAHLGLESLLDRPITNLSGGERQRVAIARALCGVPDILLMDEPLAALDQAAKQTLLPYLEQLSRHFDVPIVYVTHSLDEIAQLADYLVVMARGAIAYHGDTAAMLTRLDTPLAQAESAESVVQACVIAHDNAFGLSYLDSPIGRVSLLQRALPVGAEVRLRIAARDVSITLEQQTGSSILNVFPAVVDSMVALSPALTLVRVLAGENPATAVPVVARITSLSASRLALQPGKSVFIQAKSVALF